MIVLGPVTRYASLVTAIEKVCPLCVAAFDGRYMSERAFITDRIDLDPISFLMEFMICVLGIKHLKHFFLTRLN